MNENLAFLLSGILTFIFVMSAIFLTSAIRAYSEILAIIFMFFFAAMLIFFSFFRRVDEQKQ